MLEGALLFVTATSRRLESNQHATLAYPFTVYASSGGSGAMAQGDAASARGEIWMPLWSAPAQLTELRALLAEGRATLGRRPARDGLDFARAVSRLGTDRGIGAFQRYGFMVRNGLAYLATPIARVESPHAAQSDLVADLERGQFLDLLRRHARGKDTPASLKRSVAQLENALFALTRPGAGQPTIQRALILLGEVMQTLAVSRKGQEGVWLVPSLSERWVLGAYRDSAEFRIALALASLPRMTAHVAPVGWNRAAHRWEWQRESRSCVWGKGNLVRNLAQIVARRVVEAVRSEGGQEPFAAPTKLGATNRDLAAFLATEAYDAGIAALVRGLVWARLPDALPPAPKASNPVATSRCTLPVAFGILKPFFVGSGLLRELNRLPQDAAWTAPSEIPRLLVAGQVQDALSIAWRRSHTAGMGWPQGACPLAPALDGPRLLAALMTPLQRADLAQLVPRKEEQHSPNRAAHS
jgi:CRISPR-associated protein Csx17